MSSYPQFGQLDLTVNASSAKLVFASTSMAIHLTAAYDQLCHRRNKCYASWPKAAVALFFLFH